MKLISFILLTYALNSFANEKGNGGDALVCYDSNNNIQSVQLLDYYEAIHKKRIKKIDLGEKDGYVTYDQKVNFVLDRLAKLNPTRAELYRKWYKEFFLEENFKWGGKLVNIADTGVLDFPQNCEVEQLAAQEEPMLDTDKRYTIRKDLWDIMDEDNRAGIILHELVYREAINQKVCFYSDTEYREQVACKDFHSNSRRVRYYTSFISSQKMNKTSLKKYIPIVQTARLKNIDINSLPIDAFTWNSAEDKIIFPAIKYHNDDTVKSWHPIQDNTNDPYPEELWGNSIEKCHAFNYSGYYGCLQRDKEVLFYKNGNLESAFTLTDPKATDVDFVTFQLSETIQLKYKKSYDYQSSYGFRLFFDKKKSLFNIRHDKFSGYIYLTIPGLSKDIQIKIRGESLKSLNLSDSQNTLSFDASRVSLEEKNKHPIWISNVQFASDGSGRVLKVCKYISRNRRTPKIFCGTIEEVLASNTLRSTLRKQFQAIETGASPEVQNMAFNSALKQCNEYIESNIPVILRKFVKCSDEFTADKCFVSGFFKRSSTCLTEIELVNHD